MARGTFKHHVALWWLFLLFLNWSHAAPQSNSTLRDLASDLGNWMSLLPEDLKTVPLNLLAIPGTHDSFTVNITSESDVAPDGEDILRELEFLTIVKWVISNWSKTQAYNVTQQLEAGIRFFDLRFCFDSDDGNLYFCHRMYSTEVRSALSEMKSYLDNHPNEVVILDCQHFHNFTSSIHVEVTQMLIEIFGSKLIPYQTSMSFLTLKNLNSLKQQVLLVYRDSTIEPQETLFWPTESYPTPWYNTMNATYLIASLDEGITDRSNQVGHVSQLIWTPSLEDILDNVLSTLKQKCAIDYNDVRMEWIANQIPGENGVNVIIADFVDLEDDTFSKTVVNLNLKLNSERLGAGGVLHMIQQLFQGVFNR